MMETIIAYITTHIALAPWIIFGLLLLAGFNIPISEDGMLFISAILAAKYPDRLVALFMAVFWGAYLSDLICYWLGRLLGPQLWKIRVFASMVSHDRVIQLNHFYNRYGIWTLLFGRFIPFGVRNGLFLTAGLGKMNFIKFMVSDFVACVISCTTYFTLYYRYGRKAIALIQQSNYAIFTVAIVVVLVLVIKQLRSRRSSL